MHTFLCLLFMFSYATVTCLVLSSAPSKSARSPERSPADFDLYLGTLRIVLDGAVIWG